MLLVEQNVQSALRGGRSRLRDEPRHASCTKGRPRSCATTQRCGGSCWGCDGGTPLLRVEHLAKQYTRGLRQQAGHVLAGGGLHRRRARGGRRDGPQRLGQDHAVRADHRQQPAQRRPRAGERPGHPPGANARARPPGDPLPPVLPGALVPAQQARTSCWSTRRSESPLVHLFDEPQFNTQDGYIGFMLDFFAQLRRRGQAGVPVPAPQRAVPRRHPAPEPASASSSCTRAS